MTLLERKKRQYESSKMIKSIRKVIQKRNHQSYRRNTTITTTNYNSLSTIRSMVPFVVPSSSPKSSLQQQKVSTENRIPIDEMTCKIIELVVEKLLCDNLSELKHKKVTILELGNALVSSRHVLDSYANASSADNSSSLLLLSSANRGRFWNNTIQRQRRNHRKQLMINERIQLQRRYAWMNVMNQLQSKANASTETISTWENAKNALRTVLVLPEEEGNDDGSDDNNDEKEEVDTSKENGIATTATSTTAASRNDDTMEKNDKNVKEIIATTTPSKMNKKQLFKSTSADSFIQRLEAIKLEETSKSIGIMLPSQHKWQEVLVQASISTDMKRQQHEKETKLLQEKYDTYDEKYDTYKTHKKDVLVKLDQKLELIEKEKLAREKVAKLLRPLTKDEMQSVTHELTNQKANPNDILRQVGTDVLVRSSFQTLCPGQWLNDEVIHYFLIMLQNRDEQLCANTNRKRSHFFKSFFMTKLRNEGHPKLDGQYTYTNVKRWSKNVPGKDIFALRRIFFVINVGQMHWTCACAHMDECEIHFYDSMGSSGNGGGGIHYLKDIFQYIQDEHKDKKKVPLPNVGDWKLVPCTSDTPRQLNGYDCGVFTCMFADFLSIDCPLIFSQEHVTECRQRIALSILQGKALM